MKDRKFVFFFFFVGWDCISIGFHVCLSMPNIEIHIPFGFIKIGLNKRPPIYNQSETQELNEKIRKKVFGWDSIFFEE